MPAPTGSLFNTKSIVIEEIINKTVGVFLPGIDKVFEDLVVTNQGVGNVDDFGRDWLIIKTFHGSLAGVIDGGGPTNDFTLYGDATTSLGSKLFLQQIVQTYPDATQGPNAASYRLAVPMRSMLTNLMLTQGEAQAEAHPAFIGNLIAPKLQGFARNMAQQICNYWYLSQNSFYALGTLGGGSGTGWNKTLDTNSTLMVDLKYSTYAIDRFMVGMRVDIYDSTGATARVTTAGSTNTQWIVSAVDELVGKVYFKAYNKTTGAALTDVNTASIADDDIIVYARTKGSGAFPASASAFTGIAGLNSWMKFGDASASTDTDANCLLGGERVGSTYNINVNVHPEFKSFTFNNGGDPMTEHRLRLLLRRWHAAKGRYGMTIDCLVASDGIWLAYADQKTSRQYYERTGRLDSSANEGSDGTFKFTMDGRTYMGYTSNYIEAGTIYGFKKANNWKRYVPPDPKNVKKMGEMPAFAPFRFVGSALTGNSGPQMPILAVANNRTLPTEGTQLPGQLRMQLVPDQPAGLKITNVAEDRIYAS